MITPDNITSIVFQYKLNRPGLEIGLVSIVVFYDTPERQATIILAETQHYIRFLIIKAAVLGKVVLAIQDLDNTTTLTVGDPPIPPLTDFIVQENGLLILQE